MTPTEVRASFPADPTSAGEARRFVDATLRRWSCDHFVDVASLLVSELVANAVLHAGTSIAVVVRVDGDRLRVEVHDGNGRLPARKHYSTLSATGRGLMLVERMSRDWGVAATSGGKVVWFELEQQVRGAGALERFALPELDLEALGELGETERPVPTEDEGGGPAPEAHPRLRAVPLVPALANLRR